MGRLVLFDPKNACSRGEERDGSSETPISSSAGETSPVKEWQKFLVQTRAGVVRVLTLGLQVS